MADKKKRGVAGASNAKNIPFRYHGGTYDKPAYNPLAKNANLVKAGDYKGTSKYITGCIGGVVLAKLGFRFDGDVTFDPSLGSNTA